MDDNIHKRSISEGILLLNPFISTQVLTEVANVCKRRFKYEKEDILNLWSDLMSDCDFIATTKSTFEIGINLVKKYKFQLFDALIIASALEANCNTLYSEDMQHKMLVEGKLIIVNPFI